MSPRASGARRSPAPDDDPFDPNDYLHVFGQTFAKHEHAPLLVIGNRQWTRWQLSRMGCPHPVAAATLNRVIQHLKIQTIAELAEQAAEIATYRGCGITVYSLVFAILRDAGYAAQKIHQADVTYTTLKQRARRDEGTTTRRKRRKGRA